ncbi:MAG: class I SAM-dependent methyltransferase, partial [Anaerolineae bacterium]
PEERTTEALLYDHMPSQSGRSLPIIYRPFDPADRGHWRDRGAALDFVLATRSAGRRVLDFGPGDGWPSLIIAPEVAEVVGVEGSHHRVSVCERNAARLDVTNARFRYVEPGTPLPFPDESFDAAVAASSLEQTPDPQATLTEIYRVLRPSGRLRIRYEALNRYRDGQEREVWLWEVDESQTRLVIYDRDVENEKASQIVLVFDIPQEQLADALGGHDTTLRFEHLTVKRLARLRDAVIDAGVATTRHPSGATWQRWTTEAGFRQVFPTHDGIRIAGEIFDHLPEEDRPMTMTAIDAYLRPIIEVVVEMAAPIAYDPAITAVK